MGRFKPEKKAEPIDRLFLAAQMRIQELEDLVDVQAETIKHQARAIDHWRSRARTISTRVDERDSFIHPTNPLLDRWD